MNIYEVADDPRFRKLSKVISIISIIILAGSISYSITILNKYKDYPEFSEVKQTQIEVWEYFDPERLELWKEYQREQYLDGIILGIGIFLFLFSGLPIWADNIRNPKRMFSSPELKLLRKLRKTLKTFTKK